MLPAVCSYLVVTEVDTVAKDHRDVPLVDTIVLLVHPLVEDIRVQNPAGVHLQKTHTHNSESWAKVRKLQRPL